MSDLKITNLPIEKPMKNLDPNFKPKSHAQLQKVAQEFETMFMNVVMKSMRDTVGENDTFGDSEKVKFFQTMLDEEFSKISAAKSRLGLAAAIMKQLEPKLEAQERAQAAGAEEAGSEGKPKI